MDFLFINTHELSALSGLPHLQRLTYLMGIRPYLDRATLIVGVKRKISYQSLSEALYVEPHPGIKSGSPSKQQLRRVIAGLEQAGLIAIQSTSKNLILKCLLAGSDNSVSNKADTKSASDLVISKHNTKPAVARPFKDLSQKTGMGKTVKPGIPHNSDPDFIFLCEKFKKFWSCYPQQVQEAKSWEAFQNLNPDDVLFSQIMINLETQKQHYQTLKQAGYWVPAWRYPANWLNNQCWNDELIHVTKQEQSHAHNSRTTAKKSSFDGFWESCKGGADFSFGEDEYGV